VLLLPRQAQRQHRVRRRVVRRREDVAAQLALRQLVPLLLHQHARALDVPPGVVDGELFVHK
jgi:hypothetical protein